MEKISVLKGQKGFSEFYPGSIAMITAVDLEGLSDICKVGVWALVNGKPPMYGFPLCNKDMNKRKEKPLQVKPPLIGQCPVNIECRLINIVAFSCRDWVAGEAVAIHRAFNDVDMPMPIPVLKMANACAGKKRLA